MNKWEQLRAKTYTKTKNCAMHSRKTCPADQPFFYSLANISPEIQFPLESQKGACLHICNQCKPGSNHTMWKGYFLVKLASLPLYFVPVLSTLPKANSLTLSNQMNNSIKTYLDPLECLAIVWQPD